MKYFALVTGLVALLAAGAWAADLDAKEVTVGPNIVASPGYDDTRELKWDNGGGRWWLAWYTGAGSWVGNDFNISTIKTFGGIKFIRYDSTPTWPNTTWDGFRLGVYSFAGGIPGSMMWPTSGGGYFFVPTGGRGKKDCPVNWVLPSGVKKFVAAMEQFYNNPNCDPYLVDSTTVFCGHSWEYYEGAWAEHRGYQGYKNVVLRVVVDNEQNPAVLPTSIGRVKALYY